MSVSTIVTYIFIVLTCTTIIITLEPCALNVEFQHFIGKFNKISYFVDTTNLRLKEGFGGERRLENKVKTW